MPELPEVETFRRYLTAVGLHRRITGVSLGPGPELAGRPPWEMIQALLRRSFLEVRRHGKHLFLALAGGGWLVMHFGMTGFPKYLAPGAEPPRHARLRLDFAGGGGLAYSSLRRLGRLELTPDPAIHITARSLGPDALAVGFPAFHELAVSRRGGAKAAFLDQGFLAGLGNLWSDEVLFQAGIHPRRKMADLDRREVERLYDALQRVLDTGIRAGADWNLLPPGFLLRGGPERETCPGCGGDMAGVRIGGRAARFCPVCQAEG